MLADCEHVVAAYHSIDILLTYQIERRGPLLYHGSIPTMLCFNKLEASSNHLPAPLYTTRFRDTKLFANIPQIYVKMRLQIVAIFSLFMLGLALPVHEKRHNEDCVGEQLISLSTHLAPAHPENRVTDIRLAAD